MWKGRNEKENDTERRRLSFVSAPVILIFITQAKSGWGEMANFIFSPFPETRTEESYILMCFFLFLLLRLLSSLLHWVVASFKISRSLSCDGKFSSHVFLGGKFTSNKHNVNVVIQKGILSGYTLISNGTNFILWRHIKKFRLPAYSFYVCIMHAMILFLNAFLSL